MAPASTSPPLLVHPITVAEVLVAAVHNDVAEVVWADLTSIGVEIDDMAIDPWLLARLRVKTGCKMPDCCVLASAATRNTAVGTFDERLRRHADGDLS